VHRRKQRKGREEERKGERKGERERVGKGEKKEQHEVQEALMTHHMSCENPQGSLPFMNMPLGGIHSLHKASVCLFIPQTRPSPDRSVKS